MVDKNKFGFRKAEWEIMKKNDGGIIELEEERARKKAAVRERKKKPKMKVSGKSVFGLQKIMRKHQGAAPAAGAAPKFP